MDAFWIGDAQTYLATSLVTCAYSFPFTGILPGHTHDCSPKAESWGEEIQYLHSYWAYGT
ncbi:hypothetical protein ANO14919_103240 [Xylariales sp. No.14919]|nr:hypothetical protein ANO14919_103240 [Xylariales sp. No.14919]